jgi:hypothetical protein
VIKGFKLGALFGDACHPRPLGSNVSLSDLISSVTQAGKVWRLDGLLKALLADSQPRSSSGVF